MNYKNKVIWVTGASSGIGRALCLELDRQGAKLIISSRNIKALEQLMGECQFPENHRVLSFDVTEIAQIPDYVSQALAFYNRLDILFNNAGIGQRSLVIDTEIAVDRSVMEVDYFAPVALTKSILPQFIQQQEGMIINIASVAGKLGSPMRSAYSAAKHALIGYMDCLRAEVVEKNIKVINVCPSFVKTNISYNALTGNLSQYNKMDEEIKNGMTTTEFLQILFKQLQSNKQEIIIAKGLPKLGYQLRRFFPNLYHWILPKIYEYK